MTQDLYNIHILIHAFMCILYMSKHGEEVRIGVLYDYINIYVGTYLHIICKGIIIVYFLLEIMAQIPKYKGNLSLPVDTEAGLQFSSYTFVLRIFTFEGESVNCKY